jgi:Aspartyl protease
MHRLYLTTALLIALAGCTVSKLELASNDVATPPAEVLLYAESTRPDELKRIVVPVMLNEQGPFYFLLDTGATRTVIAKSAVTRLALQTDEQQRVDIRSVSSVMRVPTVVMSSLQVGALRSTQVRMPVLSGLVLDGVDGILGVDVLGDTKVTADFLNNHIRITTANGEPADSSRLVFAFTQMARRPIMVDAWVGGIRTRAIVDTGCAHTLGNAVLLNVLQKQQHGQLAIRSTEVSDATDATLPAQLALVPSMIVGTLGIQNLPVSFGEFSVFDIWKINDRPALLIGMDVLSLVDELAIDYRRKELQVAMPMGK